MRYLLYVAKLDCATVARDVCKDLVLYDTPSHNPRRQLVPLSQQHPVLLQIMIANSALHMSNTRQGSLFWNSRSSSPSSATTPSSSSSLCPTSPSYEQSYYDALEAKQRALQLLKNDLPSLASVDVDVTLAVVLLFIEFELIDTGRDSWKHHVNGARIMIHALCQPTILKQTTMSPLRRCLISNCLVYVDSQ